MIASAEEFAEMKRQGQLLLDWVRRSDGHRADDGIALYDAKVTLKTAKSRTEPYWLVEVGTTGEWRGPLIQRWFATPVKWMRT